TSGPTAATPGAASWPPARRRRWPPSPAPTPAASSPTCCPRPPPAAPRGRSGLDRDRAFAQDGAVAATTPLPRLLVLATMLSGAAALVDEMVWVRLLGQVFGHTAYAVQVVLAVFFAGVAAGSAASDRWLLSPRRLLIAYAAVELGVGLAALLFPWMVGRAIPLY